MDSVTLTKANGIATTVLDRPARNNAMDLTMQDRFGELMRQVNDDSDVRTVIVTGAGATFCPGGDLGALSEVTAVLPAELRGHEGFRHVLAPALCAKPVIAAVNGACAGLGLVLACAADVRFAAAAAKFTTAFVRRGYIASYGVAKLLPEIVGRGRALDLLLSGRTFTAEQALAYGLVQEVVPPQDLMRTVVAYADQFVRHCAPRSMAVIKEQVLRATDMPLFAAAKEATELMFDSFGRPELAEGVASWKEGRLPAFPAYPRGS